MGECVQDVSYFKNGVEYMYHLCDGSGEDPEGHNGGCPWGVCLSIYDHCHMAGLHVCTADGGCDVVENGWEVGMEV